MNIYFAASILGSQAHPVDYMAIVELLKAYGTVLTEHVGTQATKARAEHNLTFTEIHDRDIAWLLQADVVVAEISNPSLGVGYEIGRAVEHDKRVLCVYSSSAQKVSGMLQGSSALSVRAYQSIDELKAVCDEYFGS